VGRQRGRETEVLIELSLLLAALRLREDSLAAADGHCF
jgi:hypothetical protein